MPDKQDPLLARSMAHLQENLRRAGPAASVSYTLIGAILLLGALGGLIDRWQDTAPWGLVIGLLAGVAVGLYEMAKMLWTR